jgi:hypothetical protein
MRGEQVSAPASRRLANVAIVPGRKLRWDPEARDLAGGREARGPIARRRRAPYSI